jgi:CRP/FNR family transcriptional regulator, cyclic AMP receptor protein
MGTIDTPLYMDVDYSRGHSDGLIDSLLSARLFAGIHREEIVAILWEFDEQRFNHGHRVTMQGLRGSDFYIVFDGHARVLVDEKEIATLGPGEFFGEVGVLSDGLRTATVEATTQLRTLVLSHNGLEPLLMAHPKLAVNLLREVLNRFRSVSTASAGMRESSPDR